MNTRVHCAPLLRSFFPPNPFLFYAPLLFHALYPQLQILLCLLLLAASSTRAQHFAGATALPDSPPVSAESAATALASCIDRRSTYLGQRVWRGQRVQVWQCRKPGSAAVTRQYFNPLSRWVVREESANGDITERHAGYSSPSEYNPVTDTALAQHEVFDRVSLAGAHTSREKHHRGTEPVDGRSSTSTGYR